MRKALVKLATLAMVLNFPATAMAQCTDKACVEVSVKDGQILIEGKRKGSTTSPKPAVTRSYSYRATAKSSSRPKSVASTKVTTRATIKSHLSAKPSSKPIPGKTTPSLSDRILQSLPTLQVAYQPEGKVLTRVPVIFFTDLPTFFNKTFRILGVPVRIDVHPSSLWDFGDGSKLITNKPGRPYPATDISHSYSVPGIYLVKVETIWTGTYTIAGFTEPIIGAIRQSTAVDLKVVGASTRFVGK